MGEFQERGVNLSPERCGYGEIPTAEEEIRTKSARGPEASGGPIGHPRYLTDTVIVPENAQPSDPA